MSHSHTHTHTHADQSFGGESRCEFIRTDHATAVFRGTLDNRVPALAVDSGFCTDHISTRLSLSLLIRFFIFVFFVYQAVSRQRCNHSFPLIAACASNSTTTMDCECVSVATDVLTGLRSSATHPRSRISSCFPLKQWVVLDSTLST